MFLAGIGILDGVTAVAEHLEIVACKERQGEVAEQAQGRFVPRNGKLFEDERIDVLRHALAHVEVADVRTQERAEAGDEDAVLHDRVSAFQFHEVQRVADERATRHDAADEAPRIRRLCDVAPCDAVRAIRQRFRFTPPFLREARLPFLAHDEALRRFEVRVEMMHHAALIKRPAVAAELEEVGIVRHVKFIVCPDVERFAFVADGGKRNHLREDVEAALVSEFEDRQRVRREIADERARVAIAHVMAFAVLLVLCDVCLARRAVEPDGIVPVKACVEREILTRTFLVEGQHIVFVTTVDVKQFLAVLEHDELADRRFVHEQPPQARATVVDVEVVRHDDAARPAVAQDREDLLDENLVEIVVPFELLSLTVLHDLIAVGVSVKVVLDLEARVVRLPRGGDGWMRRHERVARRFRFFRLHAVVAVDIIREKLATIRLHLVPRRIRQHDVKAAGDGDVWERDTPVERLVRRTDRRIDVGKRADARRDGGIAADNLFHIMRIGVDALDQRLISFIDKLRALRQQPARELHVVKECHLLLEWTHAARPVVHDIMNLRDCLTRHLEHRAHAVEQVGLDVGLDLRLAAEEPAHKRITLRFPLVVDTDQAVAAREVVVEELERLVGTEDAHPHDELRELDGHRIEINAIDAFACDLRAHAVADLAFPRRDVWAAAHDLFVALMQKRQDAVIRGVKHMSAAHRRIDDLDVIDRLADGCEIAGVRLLHSVELRIERRVDQVLYDEVWRIVRARRLALAVVVDEIEVALAHVLAQALLVHDGRQRVHIRIARRELVIQQAFVNAAHLADGDRGKIDRHRALLDLDAAEVVDCVDEELIINVEAV